MGGANFGDGNSPVMSFDGVTGTLSFSDGVVNTLGLNGEPSGVHLLFAFDPILGATISMTDFELLAPMDNGFLFGGGSLEVHKGGNIFLSADIPFLLIDDTMKAIFGNNMVGEFANLFINDSLGSLFLEAFENSVFSPSTLATEFFGLTSLDLVPLIASGMDFATPVKVYGGHSVPEPSTLALFGIGLASLGCIRWRRRKKSSTGKLGNWSDSD